MPPRKNKIGGNKKGENKKEGKEGENVVEGNGVKENEREGRRGREQVAF